MPFDMLTDPQKELEMLYSKYQLISCIKDEFIEAGFVPLMEEHDMPTGFGLDLLTQMELHKRANISILVGMLKKHFEEDENPAQACADMILKACEIDLVDWSEVGQQVVVKYTVSADVRHRIDQFQYPLPMIHEPLMVKTNKQTGYTTIKGSLILKNNHHDDDICLDHINRMNQIPLTLNTNVIAFVRNQWKNLDKAKPGETTEDFKKRQKAFDRYDTISRDVIDALMEQSDRLWLTHKYDKRGRSYAQGYHVNYQGNDWNKSCIEFADKEPLNDG